MAWHGLDLLGIGQIAFDAIGCVISTNPVAESHLIFLDQAGAVPGRRLQLRPESMRSLEQACARLANADSSARETLVIEGHHLERLYGLSRREAALAHGLSVGETLLDAGHRLGLSPETTRNYSKRVYSKTGTSGQADLVRLILSGLTPLA